MARQYFRDPKLTAATIDSPSGWLRTGDLGFIDSEGFLHLVGRISDTINTGGEKVFASRIARALCAHPGISEVQVIGVPDPDWGQVVAAVAVTPDPQKAPTLEELREFCAAVLARHEKPIARPCARCLKPRHNTVTDGLTGTEREGLEPKP